MSDGSVSDGGKAKGGRVAKFKGIMKRRGRQFPVLLVMIVVLSIAMIYSLVTGMM